MNIPMARIGFAAALAASLAFGSAMAADQDPFKQSWDHYQSLKKAANGGTKKTFDMLPNWSGVWEREGSPSFDPSVPPGQPPSAKLTPKYKAMWEKRQQDLQKGIEWDYLTLCLPAGFPRVLSVPYLREFILRPEEVWWVIEQNSEVRRIYTDGRGHIPAEDSYPLWLGDSVGFWDNNTLVIHTQNVKGGIYNRGQPDYSDKTSVVERLKQVGPNRLEDEITVYDPEALLEPRHVLNYYNRITDTPDLRINHFSCEENTNVVKTSDGGSQFILMGEPGYREPDNLILGPASSQAAPK